jgi:hypothetical protein
MYDRQQERYKTCANFVASDTNKPDLLDRIWTELDIREEIILHCPACAEKYAQLKKRNSD